MAAIDVAVKPENQMEMSTDAYEDDAAIHRSQKRLHDLHIALRSLRRTLPSLLDAIIPLTTPEQLYGRFSDEAANADRSIRDFATMMRDEKTKLAIEHVNESQKNDNQDVEAWKWDDNPDWLDAGKEFGRYREESAEAKENANDELEATVRDAVEAVKNKSQIQASMAEHGRRIKLELAGSANLQFEIVTQRELETAPMWNVVADAKSKLATSIAEVVNAKVSALDIRQLLDLLSSYSEVKQRPCDKCSHLLNSSGQLPLLRLPIGLPDGKYKAFHQACA